MSITKVAYSGNLTVITGGMVPKGAFNAGTTYAIGDSVSYSGSSYVMYSLATAGTLPTNTTYWQVIANQGSAGSNGSNGSNGSTGATGPAGEGIVSGFIYFPNSASANVDGTWRIGIVGTSLVMQLRESGTYNTKAEATP